MKKSSLCFRYILFLFAIVTLLYQGSCRKKSHTAATFHSKWVSSNPLTIPYRVRIQKKELGNLLSNPDFEQGKYFYFDTLPQGTFDIDGWKKVGENVQWVDIKNRTIFDSSEVAKGIHAVKIHRLLANETEDTGEGIISDFIKVIPGNYQLSLDIKLKDVHSHKARLGTKIYNSIDIRVVYYDKNKLEINSNKYSPHYLTNINTSFKGYPFSNFWSIDSLGWTRVFCKSANYPFPEGNIPDDTRFVKIFLGFKGEGTMWVDNVDYRYTDYNFSVKELIQPLFNRSFDKLEMLHPTPQKIQKLDSLPLTDSSIFLILSATENQHLADTVASQLNRVCSTIISKSVTVDELTRYTSVLSIGNTNFFRNYRDSLYVTIKRDHPGSYNLRVIVDEIPLFFIHSDDNEGLFYGCQRFQQLIDIESNMLHMVNMDDWPWFSQRGFIALNPQNNTRFAPDQFINGWITVADRTNYLTLPDFVHTGNIVELEQDGKDKFEMNRFIAFDKKNAVDEQYINPYIPANSQNLNNHNQLTNAKNLISYSNWNHTEMLDMFYDKFDSYYRNNELFYSRSLAFSWSGMANVSYLIDETGYIRYQNYVKRPVWFIDRTLSENRLLFTGHASRFLVPIYRTGFTDEMMEQLKNSVWFELPAPSPLSHIAALTAADFAWNPAYYDPWFSAFKALVNAYGRQNARDMIDFNDQYQKLSHLLATTTQEQLNNRIFKTTVDQLDILKDLITAMNLPESETYYFQNKHKQIQRTRNMLFSNTKFIEAE